MNGNYILEIQGLQKSYGKFTALKDISFNVARGKIIGLLGKNGAGKTTLIKTILGLLKNYNGKIIYDGTLIDTSNPVVMSSIGSLVDTAFHEDLTAYDNLKLLMMVSPSKVTKNQKEDILELLKLVGLTGSSKSKVKSFSFGMKQRLALAQALMGEPKLLVLDEPFVGLDPLGIEMIKNKLLDSCREKGVSVIFSSHQLSEVAEISDDIVIIKDGKIDYSGTYTTLADEAKKYHIILNKELDIDILKNFNIIISDDKKEIVINHSDNIINEALKTLFMHDLSIKNITVEENALFSFFKS